MVDLENRDPFRDVTSGPDDPDHEDVPEGYLVQADRPAGIAAYDVPAVLRPVVSPKKQAQTKTSVTYGQGQRPQEQVLAHHVE